MTTCVLGLTINDYGTSAAVVDEHGVAAAAQEERFNREKRTRRFPVEAMRFCLKKAGVEWKDIDAAAVSVNPAIYLANPAPAQSERARYRGELLYAPLNLLLAERPAGDCATTELALLDRDGGALRVQYVTHHDCHAAAAFFLSPFDSGAVLSIDGFGEQETCVSYRAQGTTFARLRRVLFPHSLGCFYSAMTEFLGLMPNRHEWKLMAAAAGGDAQRFLAKVRELIRRTPDDLFEVNLPYFTYFLPYHRRLFSDKLVELLGEPYAADAEPDRRFFDLAAAVQRVTEEIVFGLLRDLAREVKTPNLCFTGGVAMNCVLNGRIPANTPFQNVFVPPMPDDSGGSIGAALHVAMASHGGARPEPLGHSYFGPAFTDRQIEDELQRDRLPYERLERPAAQTAQMIADGAIVGWFQGAMEFGDRALGNRSILADPRKAAAAQRIRESIKNRRAHQPFAPSMLAERIGDYFCDGAASPFMEKTFRARPEKAAQIPAVLAADGTARVQTVTAAQNPLFRELLEHFQRRTDCPMVLNTSFNLSEEPMVCSIRDAVRTFYSAGLDALIAGPFLLRKKP